MAGSKVTVTVAGEGVERGSTQVSLSQAKKACWNNSVGHCLDTPGQPLCNLTVDGCYRGTGAIAHPNQLPGVKITTDKQN